MPSVIEFVVGLLAVLLVWLSCLALAAARARGRTTSNLGVRLNLYESADERFRTNAKYTHHSCAFSPDDRQYDAVAVELEYKLWER